MKKKILVAPLDWGLGHASRCIPIIRELQRKDCEVILAGNGRSLQLLHKEFPHLRSFTLPGYEPEYPSKGSMIWKMVFQVPKFLSVIKKEHAEIERLVKKERVEGIISDNRYGCWSAHIPSVFITHQSNILMPKRFGWLAPFVRNRNEYLMNNFSRCWLPDFPDRRLSGNLISLPNLNPKKDVQYIGPLSRFTPSEKSAIITYDVAAIFSGPEPQRTIFEEIVMSQLQKSELRYFIVRGLPDEEETTDSNIANFMTSVELQTLIESSQTIIARSGYSTVMDLSALGKKAIFIPTPEQTEQEYLAKRLMERGIAYSVKQSDFNLAKALKEVNRFKGFGITSTPNSLLEKAVDSFIQLLE